MAASGSLEESWQWQRDQTWIHWYINEPGMGFRPDRIGANDMSKTSSPAPRSF